MTVPVYEGYQDSGVDWIGLIPAGWRSEPLKVAYSVVGGATPKSEVEDYWDGGVPWVTPGDLSKLTSSFIRETIRTISEEGLAACAASKVPTGSVILSTRAPIGSLGITTEPATTNQGCKALVPRKEANPRFLAYTLSVATRALNVRGKGTTFLELSGDELARFKVPTPSPAEQSGIAAFLDWETGKIDALVEAQRRLIELLKEKRQAVISHAVTKGLDPTTPMKDSGVEWLGDVPAHWEVVPVGYRYDVQLGRMLNAQRSDGDNLRPYLRVFDVQWGEINVSDLPQMDFPPEAQIRYRLEPGDLLVNEGGSYVGRSAIWRGELDECYYQKALHRVRPRGSRDTTEYLFFLMEFATKLGVFVCGGNQTTIDHLTAEQFRKYRFAFPPLSEQLEIAASLAAKTQKLATLITEAEAAIRLLEERRSALISAAVTGKIDVRGLSVRKAEAA